MVVASKHEIKSNKMKHKPILIFYLQKLSFWDTFSEFCVFFHVLWDYRTEKNRLSNIGVLSQVFEKTISVSVFKFIDEVFFFTTLFLIFCKYWSDPKNA